jgi:hypothetical protein
MVTGRGARRKGLAFEREIANRLKEVFPDARRHLENHEDDAANGADLIHTGSYRFQLKKLKAYAPINAIKQVVPEFGQVPILVTAGDFLEPMAVLPFDELLRLLKIKFKVK